MDNELAVDKDAVETELAVAEASDAVFMDSIILRSYEIKSKIGEGGMGTVYLAEHRELKRPVAIKRLRADLVKEDKAKARFQAEAEAASKVNHECLSLVRDYGLDSQGVPYIVMDFVDGDNLADCFREGMQFSVEAVVSIMQQLCQGLGHLHEKGIVHRDIKPSNIMLETDSKGRLTVKILDFGIAKQTNDETTQGITQTGEIFGTPLYMSPEQGLGHKVDGRADIYSLGCVFYELICGSPPFSGETPIQTVMKHIHDRPKLPSTNARAIAGAAILDQAVLNCLEKDPQARYQSAAQLNGDLELLGSGKAIKKYRVHGGKSGVVGFVSRHKFQIIALNVGLFLCLAASYLIPMMQPAGSPGGSQSAIPPALSFLSTAAKRAYLEDMGESFKRFANQDYNGALMLEEVAVRVFAEEVESIQAKLSTASSNTDRRAYQYQIKVVQYLMAENSKHIGDCYRRLKAYAKAVPWYEKALEVFRPDLQNGRLPYGNNHDAWDAFPELIEVLNGQGKTEQAAAVKAEWDELKRRYSNN